MMPHPTAKKEDIWPRQEGNPEGSADRTDEYSFLLRPAASVGVGVFSAHFIRAGTVLRLYADDPGRPVSRVVPRDSVPGEFIKYCIDEGNGTVTRPADFGKMDFVWFLNHSKTPNVVYDENYVYRALEDIAPDEELTIDYDAL